MSGRAVRAWLGSIAMGVLLVAGCGGDDGSADGDASAESSDSGADATAELPDCPVGAHLDTDSPVDVLVWHSYVAKNLETLEQLTQEYNDSQDDVRVQIESQGEANTQLVQKYIEAIPTGDLPDVVIMDDPATQFMADSGTVLPAEACFEADDTVDLDDFLDVAVEYYTVNGALQPGSLNIGNALLYYNRDHFEAAGLDPDAPPETLAEMREAAEAIKSAGVVDMPIVMSLQPWVTEFWLTGGDWPVVDNGNGRDELAGAGALDNEGAVEIWSWIADAESDGLLHAVNDTPGQVDHFFAMGLGEASMLPDTSSAATAAYAFVQGDLSTEELGIDVELPEGLDLDAALLPGLDEAGRGQVGGSAWYITAGSAAEVQAGAWDYLSFMNSPASQATWNTGGSFLPWNPAATEEPELQTMWEETRVGAALALAYEAVLNIDPEFPGPLIGPYAETRDEIRKSLDRVVGQGQSPADTLAEANAAITEAIERYAEQNF